MSNIPQSTKDAVRRRAEDRCEFSGGIYNLEYAHIAHRRMGGRHGKWKKIYDDPRNIALLAHNWHEVMHGVDCELKTKLIMFLKLKTDWYGWVREYGIGENDD